MERLMPAVLDRAHFSQRTREMGHPRPLHLLGCGLLTLRGRDGLHESYSSLGYAGGFRHPPCRKVRDEGGAPSSETNHVSR
jgi:hypothetical protein